MLRDDYLSVLEVGSQQALKEHLVGFAQRMGFERVGASIQLKRALRDDIVVSIHNMPGECIASADSQDRLEADPVVKHLRRSTIPIVWTQSEYVECGLGQVWEEQSVHGYANGIALALHMPRNWMFVLGVDRSQPLPTDVVDMTRLVAELQLYAVHASQAAERLCAVPALASLAIPSLTPREVECLKWTMEGKTAWEVGTILGISERTAVLHVNNAAHKLECTTKHQAVVKAIRLGLIH
jgi:DNA-binding CsgD family transcriptional regulator